MILESGKEYKTKAGQRVVIETIFDPEFSMVRGKIVDGSNKLLIYYNHLGRANTVSDQYDIVNIWGCESEVINYEKGHVLNAVAVVLNQNDLPIKRIFKIIKQLDRCLAGLGVQDEGHNSSG